MSVTTEPRFSASTTSPLRIVRYDESSITFPRTQPRVFVVAPGHLHSTRDVYDNAVAGLRALGAEVVGYPYHESIQLFMRLGDYLDESGTEHATDLILQLASDGAFPRVLAFRPHLILFVTGYVFPQAAALLLGQYGKTAVWLTEGPYQTPTEMMCQSAFRTVFTNERLMVERIKGWRAEANHPRPDDVHYLPHCYDPERHYPMARESLPAEYQSDVCFIGSPFPERQVLFGGVSWDGIDVLWRGVWSRRELDQPYAAPDGAVPNAEAHRYYCGTKIAINHHRVIRYYGHDDRIDEGEAESINLRAYELAAAGVFQISDDSRAELAEVFGDSVPTYRQGDAADLERVIRYYLAHPRERERCAAEALERVQAHTAQARMQAVLATCCPDEVV
ncbi:MAG: hypothetical protein NAOJABEB_02976 [Steroidobacteraceae bacterium]|nr:hypothetical protein [Steroidobacteraceae bacterium]